MSAKHYIVACLAASPKPMASHEFPFNGHSPNAIATRLSELQRDGIVVGHYPPGKPYKVWALTANQAFRQGA